MSVLLKGWTQPIGSMHSFVREWSSHETEIHSDNTTKDCKLRAHYHNREATIGIFVPSVERRFFAMSWKWFNQYMTIKLGAAHDCNLAELEKNSLYLISLGCENFHDGPIEAKVEHTTQTLDEGSS